MKVALYRQIPWTPASWRRQPGSRTPSRQEFSPQVFLPGPPWNLPVSYHPVSNQVSPQPFATKAPAPPVFVRYLNWLALAPSRSPPANRSKSKILPPLLKVFSCQYFRIALKNPQTAANAPSKSCRLVQVLCCARLIVDFRPLPNTNPIPCTPTRLVLNDM